MADNWVERKILREKVLREQAPDLWESAKAAVQSACSSFDKSNSPDGSSTDIQRKNGHFLTVIVHYKLPSGDSVGRVVSIQFDEQKASIFVSVDSGSPKVFLLRADETHSFIEFNGEEITADRLSEIALYDAMYKAPIPKSPSQKGRSSHTAWT